MSDLIGHTLGHFRIVEKIGEGGMGEVYRAYDERLDRDVAIKVLPEPLASNPDRLERFEREAKAVAKLAHPNILDVYELGEHEGRPFIATELLEGQNLRHSISDSGMPWRKAVEIVAAIAEGLAAAHSKGVIHRDLKPENVFKTSDGRVKVLDFGLARMRAPVDEEAETASPAPPGTAPGTVIGTLGYMSPEQLRGEPADARSDIFALGCVLYELLSGKAVFLRGNHAETTVAILKEDPPHLADSGFKVPGDLERAVTRCLEKSPDARFQSASDLAFAMRSLITGDPVPVVPGPDDDVRIATDPSKRTFRPYVLTAAGLVITLVASWWILTQPATDDEAETSTRRFRSMTIEPVTSLGTVRTVSISPDGRQLAYVRTEADRSSIWVRQVATASEVEVVPQQDHLISDCVFAPDGEHIFFSRMETPTTASMLRVPTLGGEVKKTIDDADSPPTFSPDGQRLAFRRGIPGRGFALMVANTDGSYQKELASGEWMSHPSWSPDGRTIATALTSPEGQRFFAIDVETGARNAVADDIVFTETTGAVWHPDGDHLMIAGSIPGDSPNHQIWRLSVSEGTLERVSNDPNNYTNISLSADGDVLATVQLQRTGHLYVAPAEEPHSFRQLTQGSKELIADIDVDGSSVIFFRAPDGLEWGVWTCKSDASNLRRLATDPLQVPSYLSGVSSAGSIVLFTARGADDHNQIWRLDQHDESPSQVTAADGYAYSPSLSPDGSWFAYGESFEPGTGYLSSRVWRAPVSGGDPILLSEHAATPAISPDGEFIALVDYSVRDEGVVEAYLKIISAEGGKPLASYSWEPLAFPRWRPDGRAVSYCGRVDGQLWIQPLDGGPSEQLTHFEDNKTQSHAWSSDGRWLFLVRGETTSDAVLIRNY